MVKMITCLTNLSVRLIKGNRIERKKRTHAHRVVKLKVLSTRDNCKCKLVYFSTDICFKIPVRFRSAKRRKSSRFHQPWKYWPSSLRLLRENQSVVLGLFHTHVVPANNYETPDNERISVIHRRCHRVSIPETPDRNSFAPVSHRYARQILTG